jgi:hypothetical protein
MLTRVAALHGYRVVDLAWLGLGELDALVRVPDSARETAVSGAPTTFTI